MPSPPTPKAPEKVTVAPGEGRKVPLRIPGTSTMVPAEGMPVVKSLAVKRLLRTGDLVIVGAKATPAATPAAATPAAATAKIDVKEG